MIHPSHLILHHTGAEEENAQQVVKYHLSLGWRDVGYNYIIERDGKLVKGRSLEIPGAHTRAGGMNRKSIGIALIGNFQRHRPYPRQLSTLRELLQSLTAEYAIPAENILGHREVPGADTLCPGKYFPLEETRSELKTLYRVQLGAFTELQNARDFAQRLQQQGFKAFVVKAGK